MLAEAPAGDWSPSGVLGVAGVGDGYVRRLAVLFLNLFAVAGAGILGRWAVLSTAETYRLGISEASALPSMPLPAAPMASMGPAGNVIGPQEAFEMWASGRLSYDAGGEVTGDAAYQDYAETCRLNNLQAISMAKFGGLLTRLADSSQGRVMKVKSNGQMRYRGVRLPDGVAAGSAGYGAVH